MMHIDAAATCQHRDYLSGEENWLQAEVEVGI